MSNNSLPIHGINQSQRNMRDSISRLVTGIKVLGGNDVADQTMANTLNAEGASFNRVVKNTQKGIDLLTLVESALTELNSLATRLKELGVADTLSTNSSDDTAALDSETEAISDTIDSIISTLTFNSMSVLSASTEPTFAIGINQAGGFTTISTSQTIAATNITDASNALATATLALSHLTKSQGKLSGSMSSLKGYQNVASASAANMLEAVRNLQDTDYALEIAKVTKNSIINNYAVAMSVYNNQQDKDKLKLLA